MAASTTAIAAPRTLQEARQLAELELSSRLGHAVTLRQQPQHAAQRDNAVADHELLPYYHFSEGEAFVFISGSDLLPAVIGYGEGMGIDTDRALPANLQEWLDQVAETEAYLENNPKAAMAQAGALEQAAAATFEPIEPIMTCQWGQDEPYYNNCPKNGGRQTVVGCMATALSQIIYTQKFPAQSYGEVNYKNNGTTINASLEGVTYDYNLLLDRYARTSASDEEKAEVAKLCYNVGIASMMQYGDMSGTITQAALKGVIDHFGMSKAAYLYRNYYSLDEWNEILQSEMRKGNPVLFAAQSSAGGHAFVLDGMNDKGLYHVNWGWDGYCDGYFDVSLLRTDGAGTGASENGGFYIGQEMIVNLCDPSTVTRWYNPLVTYRSYYYTSADNIACTPSTGISRGTKLTLSAYTINNHCNAFSGKAGVEVYKDGELFDQQMGTQTFTAKAPEISVDNKGNFSMRQGDADLSASYTIPSDLADGTYKLYLVMQGDGANNTDAVRQYHFSPSFWTLEVDGADLSLSHQAYGVPFEASNWNFENEQLTTGPCTFTCTVHNNGDESMAMRYYLRLTSPSNKNSTYISAGGKYDEPFTTAPGEDTELTFEFDCLDAGVWKAKLYATPMGLDTDKKTQIDSRTFTLEADPTRAADLSLLEDPTIVNETVTNGEELTMTLKVKNTGGDYDGQMSIRLFSRSNSTADSNLKAEILNESVQISKGETKVITISGLLDVPNLTKNTALYARGFYLYGDEMKQIDGGKSTTVKVYAATGIAEVKADEEDLSNAEIYDLLGKRVSLPASGMLRPGIYIINGKKRVINK